MTATRIAGIRVRYFDRIAGKRGAPEKRAAFEEHAKRVTAHQPKGFPTSAYEYQRARRERKARGLARAAGMLYREREAGRGDYLSTGSLDYVPPSESHAAPFHDRGGAGLALAEITRKRVYAKSSKWGASTASTRYLVGRNESGTFFAHAVPSTVSTVRAALHWIWSGHESDIIERQGDIALIRGAGPKLPPLPDGHTVEGSRIIHDQHAPLRLPSTGERIIVARRAFVRASEETRD